MFGITALYFKLYFAILLRGCLIRRPIRLSHRCLELDEVGLPARLGSRSDCAPDWTLPALVSPRKRSLTPDGDPTTSLHCIETRRGVSTALYIIFGWCCNVDLSQNAMTLLSGPRAQAKRTPPAHIDNGPTFVSQNRLRTAASLCKICYYYCVNSFI